MPSAPLGRVGSLGVGPLLIAEVDLRRLEEVEEHQVEMTVGVDVDGAGVVRLARHVELELFFAIKSRSGIPMQGLAILGRLELAKDITVLGGLLITHQRQVDRVAPPSPFPSTAIASGVSFVGKERRKGNPPAVEATLTNRPLLVR